MGGGWDHLRWTCLAPSQHAQLVGNKIENAKANVMVVIEVHADCHSVQNGLVCPPMVVLTIQVQDQIGKLPVAWGPFLANHQNHAQCNAEVK